MPKVSKSRSQPNARAEARAHPRLDDELRCAALRVASPDAYTDEVEINNAFKLLRQHSPVHWVTPDGVVPFWAITKYADIRAVEEQTTTFVAAPRTVLSTEIVDIALCQLSGRSQLFRPLTHMDQPDHHIYRALTQSWFSSKSLQKLDSEVKHLARETVDRMQAEGGLCDFAGIVSWYPLKVIMRMLGVPDADMPLLLKLGRSVLGADDPDRQMVELPVEALRIGMSELCNYFDDLTLKRRIDPRDDLATTIANAHVRGKLIPDFERLSYYIILATGGHDTTSFAIAGGLNALIDHPDQFFLLRSNPILLDGAIEEMLRWTSPVRHFVRTATKDCELGGAHICSGDSLALFFSSGNRDESMFQDADKFRIERNPNPHIAFGHGIHFCLGHYLAKMELRAFFAEFLGRLDHIELTDNPQWARASFIGGIKSLPVRYRLRDVP